MFEGIDFRQYCTRQGPLLSRRDQLSVTPFGIESFGGYRARSLVQQSCIDLRIACATRLCNWAPDCHLVGPTAQDYATDASATLK